MLICSNRIPTCFPIQGSMSLKSTMQCMTDLITVVERVVALPTWQDCHAHLHGY